MNTTVKQIWSRVCENLPDQPSKTESGHRPWPMWPGSWKRERLRYILIGITVFIAACDGDPRSLNDEILNGLYLVHYALDFPGTPETLENCKRYNDESCLKVFEQAKQAKKQLFSVSRQDALALILGAIDNYCGMPEADHGSRCAGAITALGFFTSEEEDREILSFFSKSRGVVMQNAFMMNAEWLYVRSDKSMWERWVHSSSLDDDTKRQLVNVLHAETPEHLSIDVL